MAAFLAMAEAGGDEAPVILPEIIVTGTPTDVGYKADTAALAKIDIPIFDLPVSIQVVPREVLDDQQVIRLEDALKNVSGVFQAFNNGFGEPDYGRRGFRQFFVCEDGFRVPGPLSGNRAPRTGRGAEERQGERGREKRARITLAPFAPFAGPFRDPGSEIFRAIHRSEAPGSGAFWAAS